MLRTSGAMSLKTRRSPPQSCKDVILGQGHLPLIFVEKNFFEKVIEKEHFRVILRVLLVKPKHLPPTKTKNVYSSNREKKILHDFPVFCNVKKGVNFKFLWSWTYRAEGALDRHFSKKFTFYLPQKNFLTFLETKKLIHPPNLLITFFSR